MRDAATRPEPKWTFITPSSRSSRPASPPVVSAHPGATPSAPAGRIQHREKRLERRELIWDHRFVPAPRRDERGGALKLVPVIHPPAAPPVRDAVWQSKVNRLERVERAPNRYYWHREAGWNTCHYVDAWGEHWYGVRSGTSFYWLRRHANRWWWHDPVAHQWLLWNAGLWVWPNPSTLEIVYVGAPPPVIAPAPGVAAAAETAPSEPAGPSAEGVPLDIASAEQTIGSSDGMRLVSIYGNDHDALLFDTSKGGEPVYLAFLASGARDADFFRSNADEPWEIVLFMDDGSLRRFDADGKPYRSAAGAGLRLPGTEITQEPAVDPGL